MQARLENRSYLISTCGAEIIEDWKEQVNSDRCRDSVRKVDDNKLRSKLIVFVRHPEQCYRRHEARHQ